MPLKKYEKLEIMQVVRDGIAAGELQAELHREIAPLLKASACTIVLRGTGQIVVSPWTLARATGRCVAVGGKAVYNRGVALWAANVQSRTGKAAKAKAEKAKAAKAKAAKAKAAKAAMRRAAPRQRGARKPIVAAA